MGSDLTIGSEQPILIIENPFYGKFFPIFDAKPPQFKYGVLSISPFLGCGPKEKSDIFVSQRHVGGMTAEGQN